MHTDRLSTRHALLYTVLYCCIALLIHIPGVADYFAIPDGRETLIANVALRSPTLTLQIAGYALAVLVLNLLPLLVLLASLRVLAPVLRQRGLNALPVFLLAVTGLWIAALAFNKVYFPRSSFGLLLPVEGETRLQLLGLGALAVYLALGVLPALWTATQRLIDYTSKPVLRSALGLFLALGLMQPLYSRWSVPNPPSRQPNVILIGLDSVTPLHMQHHPGALPKLEKLFAESTVFTNTITPLARTFPAWTSVLTANYPVHSGARFNLTAFDQVDTRTTLPKLLKAQGYTTIYAQDERKFNNIDESFGFDKTVGPKPGAAEFVLTKASDHPLANLALLSPWGKQLFPFIALNRADYIHYDPDEFVTAIVDSLPQDTSKPLFLATHFCLAHYPYTWRTKGRLDADGTTQTVEEQHIHALGSLEQQIDSLIQALRQSGRLDNAILVILSDHGESLGYADGHWVSLEGHDNPHDIHQVDGYIAFPYSSSISGHGSDTLDRTQYQTLLAFQGMGTMREKFPIGTDDRITSLTDIMPTLLGALGLEVPQAIDGVNLLAGVQTGMPRTVPAETGIRFDALASMINVDEAALLRESQEYYTVDSASARLIVKPERYADLVASKDLAMHTDDWVLALLRKNSSPVFPRVAILVHKPTGAWTTGKNRALIDRAPMATLTQAFRQIYGQETADFEALWPFRAPSGS